MENSLSASEVHYTFNHLCAGLQESFIETEKGKMGEGAFAYITWIEAVLLHVWRTYALGVS